MSKFKSYYRDGMWNQPYLWFPLWVNQDKFTDRHSTCRTGSMDGKGDLNVQKRPHCTVHDIYPVEQKGDIFTLPET